MKQCVHALLPSSALRERRILIQVRRGMRRRRIRASTAAGHGAGRFAACARWSIIRSRAPGAVLLGSDHAAHAAGYRHMITVAAAAFCFVQRRIGVAVPDRPVRMLAAQATICSVASLPPAVAPSRQDQRACRPTRPFDSPFNQIRYARSVRVPTLRGVCVRANASSALLFRSSIASGERGSVAAPRR